MSDAGSAAVPSGMDSAVRYVDRRTGGICTEQIYGEASLRWVYESALGRLALEGVVKRALFSRLYGWLMSRPGSTRRIAPFLAQYGVDPAEFADPVGTFRSFNDFFVRRLKPEARPVDPDPAAVVFPADGRHLVFPDVSALDGIYAKGQRLSLPELVGDAALAARYERGALVISRLCPVDYHRFHFSVGGTPSAPRLINGPLYSVNPIALRRCIGILAENKRVLTRLSSESVGEVLILEVGATNVGSIVQTAEAGSAVAKGAEKGYFAFGGSMTMVFFEPGRVRLDEDLVATSRGGLECYARMGERLGTVA